MTVETVVRCIDPPADEPFCERQIPFESFVPFSEPIELFGLLLPKRGRIFGGCFAKRVVFFETFYMGIGREIRLRRKDTVFYLAGFDVVGFGHNNKYKLRERFL